jgi:hypothetical protein
LTEENHHVKKFKWFGAAGAIVALGSAGFLTTGVAEGSTPTITAGAGSSVSCNIAGPAKLSPPLKNDWSKAAHSGGNADPNSNATVKAAMASIPDTTYSAGSVPVTTSAKVTGTCTGTVTDGTNTASVTGIQITSSSISAGTSEATCSGLASPGTSTFTSIIKWTATGAKVTGSTATSTLATLGDAHGLGFELTASGANITGSFAGGTSDAKAYVDLTTINAIAGGPSTFDTPTTSVCEPTLKEKFTAATAGASDAVGIKLKPGKGLKLITIGPGLDATPSSITASR